ncbi:MAG TPA: translocation/assembly module TamB domain-containing protein [Steroidobacteraceae bacterium]|nr:translocation/assembly module TamB domain-containing protein [Steroidobacteraceae bacterium]
MPRWLRITAWSLGGLLGVILLGIVTLVVFGNTDGGRRFLESETAKLTSGRVRIAGFGGSFPSDIELASLELSDPKGVWMRANGISLHWSPLALLAWDMHIESLDIRAADVARRPVSSPSSKETSNSSSSTPGIDIDRMRIGTLVLEPAAAGMAARLGVAGNLHYRSMRDAQGSLVARRTNGRGDYEVTLGLGRSGMNAGLKLEEPAGGPLEHLLNLPGLGTLSVVAKVHGPQNAEHLLLDAHVGQLSANAAGTVDLVTRAAELSYSVASPSMSPRPGIAWRRIALQGRWSGPVTAPQATGVLDVEGLELADGTQLGSLKANLGANGRVLTLRATANDIILPPTQPPILQGSPLNVNATWHLDATGRPLQLSVANRLLDVDVQAVTTGSRSANFDLHLHDLTALAAAYHQDIGGTMSLSGKVAEQGRNTTLDVTGTGDLRGASLAAKLLGDDMRLHIAGSMTPVNVNVDTLDLSGRGLAVTADAQADRAGPGASTRFVESVRAHWKVSLPNLALIDPSAPGTLESTGSVDGPLESLTANAHVRTTVAVRGAPSGTVEAILQARGLPSAPVAVFQADGNFDGAPLRLEASLKQAAANTFHIVIPRMTWKSLAVNGDLTAGKSLAAARGSVHLSMAHLEDLQPLLGKPVRGAITANLDLSPGKGGPRTQFDLVASNIVAAGVSGNARLSGVGPLRSLRIDLAAQSPNIHGSPADVSADALLDAGRKIVDLDRFQAHYRGQTLHLVSASRLMYGRGLKVQNLKVAARSAVVAVDGELSPTLNFRASIHHVDAQLVDAFVPNLLSQGTFNADAQLRGTQAAPVGQASLELTGVKLAGQAAQGLPAVNMRSTARFRGETANVSAELDAGSRSRITMRGTAPMNKTGNVALKLAGRVDVALMNSILEQRGERAGGTLTVNASVSGAASEPRIRGVVQLADGDLRDYAQGVHLDHINARLVGGRGILRIASMTARAGPGQLSAHGTVGVLQPGMPMHISLNAHNIQPITNDIMTANLDTNMEVAGTLSKRLDVTGNVHINRASITIPNGLPPSVQTLNVIRPGQTPQPPPEEASKLVIGLGIALDAPAAIFVQGRGLDAQLGGRLKIAGTTDDPQVSGGFRMIRGVFSLAGTSLNFTSGKVSFNGQGLKGGMDPSLDFVAQSSVVYNGPTTVDLTISGFADSPKISLSSTPSLPQDDLLGLLLFGKPASQLTPMQLAETGYALASLSGIGGGESGGSKWNPLTWIKKAFGLNTISVGSATPQNQTGANSSQSNSTSGASLTAGKYVSNRVYVAATQSTTGYSQVQVSVDLNQYLKLVTRLGNGTATAQGVTPENDPGSSIGLAWQMSY